MTRRAIALIVVFALLTLSYASSLRVYFQQQQQISQRREEISQTSLRNYDLQDRIQRWEDPDYVRAQARERLGWVVPGEVGYVVLGSDGLPIDGSSQITRHRGLDADSRLTWWQRVWDSFVVADRPTRGDSAANASARPVPSTIEVAPSERPTPAPDTLPTATARPS